MSAWHQAITWTNDDKIPIEPSGKAVKLEPKYITVKEIRLKMSPAMMTSSYGNIFRVTGHLCGEFTGPGEFPTQRPVTRSFDVFFDLRLNKRLS